MTSRTAEGSDPSLAIRGQDGLAHSDLTPCFPSPPSQPGGEAERRWYAVSHTDGDYTVQDRAGGAGQVFATFLAKDHGDRAKALAEMVAQSPTLLAQRDALERERDDWRKLAAEYQQASDTHFAEAEASEQKAAKARADIVTIRKNMGACTDTWRDKANALKQRLSAALGEVERLTDDLDELHCMRGENLIDLAEAQALLRRVVGAVEPLTEPTREVSRSPSGPTTVHVELFEAEISTLATLSSEITALLPPSGDVEGEGKQGLTSGYASPDRPQMAEQGSGDAAAGEMERLTAALREIAESHIPSQPPTSGGDDLSWAQRHVGKLRSIALAALKSATGEA